MAPTRARSTKPLCLPQKGTCPGALPPSELGLSWCSSRWGAAASKVVSKKPKRAKIWSFRPCWPCKTPSCNKYSEEPAAWWW